MGVHIVKLRIMMNSLYVANDTVVFSSARFSPNRPERKRGGNSKIVDSGSAESFDPLFKTD
jgi:hypothetical protein